MGRFTSRSLLEDITYWPPTSGATNDFGHPIFVTPVLITGRWEDKLQQIRKANGEEVTSSTMVYVDRDLDISGYLAQGDLTDEVSPLVIDGAKEIQATMTTPDLRNLDHERIAYL